MRNSSIAFLVFLQTASICCGQTINVAIGPTDIAPSSAYAGAGQAGFWNAIEAQHASSETSILDVNGNTTGLRIRQIGGMLLRSVDDPLTTGDDQALLDHCQVTFSPSLETCIFIDFLEPGEYEVICYAWMPGQPNVRAFVNSEEEPGNPHKIVEGGVWTGRHEELVTYSRHQCFVDENTNGLLRLHSGVVPGDSAALGAAMNGFQVRQFPDVLIGDINGDGEINLLDVGPFVNLLSNGEFQLEADINFDGAVNLLDVDPFVGLLAGN